MEAPAFSTERLNFRGFRKTDFDASFALWAEPEVYKHIMGRPCSPEECWSRILRYAGHWNWFGYGYWALEDKATGKYIGEIGLADFHRTIVPSLDGRPEMGWILTPSVHGNGLGTEAAKAVAAWGDKHLPINQTACIIVPENKPSLRLAEKIGFRRVHNANYNGDDTLILHRN